VGTTSSPLHKIGEPVYITHWASKTSEHGSGSGHPAGVGHGGRVTNASSHPQLEHLVSDISLYYYGHTVEKPVSVLHGST
jgi:hypothetical protein